MSSPDNDFPRPPLQLSDRVRAIPEALSIYINQIVYDLKRRGYDVITLSLGEAFFDIPLFDFHKLDPDKRHHYSDSQGIPSLRAKIADFYGKHYNAPVDPETELLISAGSKPIIFMAMQCALNPGDEALIHEPAWLSYQEQLRLLDVTPRFIPYDATPDQFGDYFTDKTRMLVINNPNNPAGRIYDRDDLQSIYRQCRSRGAYLMVDEAYSDFVLDEPFVSIAEAVPDKDGVIVINSLSKNMGISGWRVGYAIAHPDFIQRLLKVNQHLITCAPTILLYYLDYYFDEIINLTLPQVRLVVERRQRVERMMDELGLKRLAGSATFYHFVSLEDFPGSGMEFALQMLLKHHVAVVPGSAYGETTSRFIRVAIGAESEERIQQALEMIRDLIAVREFDSSALYDKLARLGFEPFEEA